MPSKHGRRPGVLPMEEIVDELVLPSGRTVVMLIEPGDLVAIEAPYHACLQVLER